MTEFKGSPPGRVYRMTWALVTLGVAILLSACNGKRTTHTETGRGEVADSSTKHGKADTGRREGETNLAGGKPRVAKKWVVVSVKKVRKLAGVPRVCSWCPSDGLLYFQLYGQTASHATQIDTWCVEANGDKLHQTPYAQAGCMSWSPSGLEFAYVPLSIFLTVMDLRSGVTRQISHQFYCGQSSWSPDGKKLVFEAATNAKTMAMPGSHQEAIWVVNADGTDERQIVDRGSGPKWLPQGDKIAFVRRGGENMVVKPDGSDLQAMPTLSRIQYTAMFDFSPDGSHIVYGGGLKGAEYADRYPPYALSVNTLDGKNEQRLLLLKGDIETPCWSPDGRRIAFCGSDTPAEYGKEVPKPDYIGIVTLKQVPSQETKSEKKGTR